MDGNLRSNWIDKPKIKKPESTGGSIIGISITISDPVIVVSSSIRGITAQGATHGAYQDATPVFGDAEVVW